MGVRATSPPRCDYTSRVRFTQTYRDGRGSQEVSIAPSLDSNRLRIGRNGPIIALWAAVQPAKSLILGTSGLIDPPGPRLRPPDLYIIRKLSERRIRLSNNTNFDNVALNAKFITHAHEIIVRVGAPPRSDPHWTDFFSILAQKTAFCRHSSRHSSPKNCAFFRLLLAAF